MVGLTRGRFDSGLVTWLKFCNGYWAIAVALVFFSSRLVVFFRLKEVIRHSRVTGCPVQLDFSQTPSVAFGKVPNGSTGVEFHA